MIIGRRILVIDTPGSTLDPIRVRSIVARFNEGDGSFRDCSASTALLDAVNHHYAVKQLGSTVSWSDPVPYTETEYREVVQSIAEETDGWDQSTALNPPIQEQPNEND